MADEILFSGLGDLTLSAALHQELILLLADRASLWRHPSIVYRGDIRATGSDTGKQPLVGLAGYDRMTAVAEGSSSSNTALTDDSANITVARQALQRQISDLANIIDAVGLLPMLLAQDAFGAAAMRFTEMIAQIVDDFSSTVGSTGVDMSVDDFFDAQFTLTQASVMGPYSSMLYPVQLTDFQNSVRAEGGAIQFREATRDMLDIKGPGFAGSFNGIDIFSSSLVQTVNAGADSGGGMWGRGALAYKDGTPAPVLGAGGLALPAGTKIMTEFERDASGALTKIVHNAYLGVGIEQDSMGVGIQTDR